jgi:hypothetical protein
VGRDPFWSETNRTRASDISNPTDEVVDGLMQDFGLSRLEVLAIIWGPTSDSGPIQSRLVDYRAIKNLVSYAKHTHSMKGSILSVYARAAPELFKDPAAAFSNLGLKFSGKAQPALTPQAATEARKRKRDGVDDNVPPSTSSPDLCLWTAGPRLAAQRSVPRTRHHKLSYERPAPGSTLRPEVSNPGQEAIKRLAREYSIPVVVAKAILMDVVPDPSECVDLRATGAMLEYNGATAPMKNVLISRLHYKLPTIVTTACIKEMKLRLLNPTELAEYDAREKRTTEDSATRRKPQTSIVGSKDVGGSAPSARQPMPPPRTSSIAQVLGSKDIDASDQGVGGLAAYEPDTSVDTAVGVFTRTGSGGLGRQPPTPGTVVGLYGEAQESRVPSLGGGQ